jgi:hypothetical protein
MALRRPLPAFATRFAKETDWAVVVFVRTIVAEEEVLAVEDDPLPRTDDCDRFAFATDE